MKYVRWAVLALLALICAAAATIFLMGLRDGADTMTTIVEINKPVPVVWNYIKDPARTKAWVSWLKEIKHLTPGVEGVGAKEVWVMEDQNNGGQLMEIASEVTRFEPLKFVEVNLSANNSFEGKASYIFEDIGANRSRLTVKGTYRFLDGFASFLQPVIMRMASSKMAGDLAKLKELAEKE